MPACTLYHHTVRPRSVICWHDSFVNEHNMVTETTCGCVPALCIMVLASWSKQESNGIASMRSETIQLARKMSSQLAFSRATLLLPIAMLLQLTPMKP